MAVSWERFHDDVRRLAADLVPLCPFHALVAITRGGLVPAAILARELDIRVVETICLASYARETQQGALDVLKPLPADFLATSAAKKILVVDDLVDTGETMKFVRTLLPKAHAAVVYAKPRGRPLVDAFAADVPQDTWIYFPWDLGPAFVPPLVGSGG